MKRRYQEVGAPESATAARAAAPWMAGVIRFCPQCGLKVDRTFKFCTNCGTRQPFHDAGMQTSAAPPVKDPSKQPEEEKVELAKSTSKKGGIEEPDVDQTGQAKKNVPAKKTAFATPLKDKKTASATSVKEQKAASATSVDQKAASATSVKDKKTASATSVKEQKAASATSVDQKAASATSVKDRKTASATSVKEQKAASATSVDQKAASATCVKDQKTASATSVKEQKTASATCVKDQKTASATCVKEEKAASATCVKDQKTASATCVKDQKTASATCVKEEKAASATSVKDQKAAAATSVKDQKAAAATSVKDQKAAAATSVKDQKAAPATSVKDQKAAAATSVKDQKTTFETSLKDKDAVSSVSVKDKAKPVPPSPRKNKGVVPVVPLPESMLLTDKNNKQWLLVKLLSKSEYGLLYEAKTICDAASSKKKYSLRLDAKDGKLYNEQNCMLRAAKKASMEKWKKLFSIPFLGIPSCIGFGLHCDYRFLVFSDFGCSLQSILDDNAKTLTEKGTFQIGVRLLDALEYLHANEYTHGNISTENVYVNPDDPTEVTLANFCLAFRYCPEGNHVFLRKGNRTPHEGSLEFISVDSHNGIAPSRRSDLASLGYCLIKWCCGPILPWSEALPDFCKVMAKKERFQSDILKNPGHLAFWDTVPAALMNYTEQVLSLEYDEKPNYEGLRTYLTEPLDVMRVFAYDPVELTAVCKKDTRGEDAMEDHP